MKQLAGLLVTALIVLFPATVSAHSKVTPSQTGIAKDETFTATVENEKDIPTIKVRLVLPSGLDNVEVYAKTGWTVDIVKDGNTIKEISWSGGEISKELKDTFTFDAQAPIKEAKLVWKIYQTYQDGSTVAWNSTADENEATAEKTNVGPASYTQVVDDLKGSVKQNDNESLLQPVIFSVATIAIVFVFVTARSVRTKKARK